MARSVLKTRLRVTHCTSFRRFALLTARAAALPLVLGLPGLAAAEQIQDIPPAAFTRKFGFRETRQKPNWINREDCLKDDVLHFDIKVLSPSDNNFEVWVGDSDCKPVDQRIGNVAKCWQVYGESAPSQSFEISIAVRDIIAGREHRGEFSEGTIENCDDNWSRQLGIYFMYVDDTGNISSNTQYWNYTGVDIEGPLPPDNVTAGPGNERIVAKWDASESVNLTSYNVYCAPAGVGPAPQYTDAGALVSNDAGASLLGLDAGMSDGGLDASADAGISTPAAPVTPAAPAVQTLADGAVVQECWGGGLREGIVPGSDLVVCGTETSRTAVEGYATGLMNGSTYAVAVAAVDELGNPGRLSNVACGVPEYVEEFYGHYRDLGGEGGGGICAVTSIGSASIGNTPARQRGTLVFVAGLAFGGTILMRRRATRRRQQFERQS